MTAAQAAQPGLTWRKHYRPGEFVPQHPLQPAFNQSPSTALPLTPARPGRTWRQHFQPGVVHPTHNPYSPVGPEVFQGIDTVPVIHMMVM